MSIAGEITRIKNNIASAYTGLLVKDASMPQQQNSANLRAAIDSLVVPKDFSYGQTNEVVAEYLISVTYDPADYSNSSIAEYVSRSTPYAKSKPYGLIVNSPVEGTLTLQDDNGCVSYGANRGENTLYNITPHSRGLYVIRDGNDEIVCVGSISPTGSLRMIYLNDADNVRDLGGWRCDGGSIRYGKLFRGSRLFISGTVNAYDRAVLHDLLGIRHELDLRYDGELEREASLIGDDVAWTHVNGAWYSISNKADWKKMLECLMNCAIEGIPVYFHCAGGADRTGALAMVVEALLGVSQSDIDKDYELTSFYSGAASDAQARRRNESEWRGLISAFDAYSGVTLRDRVAAWAVTLGIPIETINAFRAAMIDGSPEALTTDLPIYSITKSGSGVTYDSAETEVRRMREYKLTVTPDPTKIITGITVEMDGADVTDEVVSGDFVPFGEVTIAANGTVDVRDYAAAVVNVPSGSLARCSVTKTLNRSTDSNPSAGATVGDSYANVILPDSNYVIDSVAVTMNNIDISADTVFYTN